MNTAHNKDRIIDEGLKSIIRNAFYMPFNITTILNFFRLDVNEICLKGEQAEMNLEANKKQIEVAKVKAYVVPMHQNESTLHKKLKVPSNELNSKIPSSSQGVYEDNGINRLVLTSLSDSEDETVDEITQNEYILSTRKQIMAHMKDNFSSEEHYLHYFLQLIDYEKQIKDKIRDGQGFIISTITNGKELHGSKNGSAKGRGKDQSNFKSKKSLDDSNHLYALQPMMLGCDILIERIVMRKTILERFDKDVVNEESYIKLLDELIDFEESLIED